jgi:two-component system, chemotaxis family, chemotaxis protein CheY
VARTVLIVDDDTFTRAQLRDCLVGMDVDLDDVADAAQALIRVQQGGVVCVLLDLVMPKMSGMQLLAELKEHHPRIPVIVISGLDTERLIDEARSKGARLFLRKPFHPLEVQQAVRAALELNL